MNERKPEIGLQIAVSSESYASALDILRHRGLPVSAIVDMSESQGFDRIHLNPVQSNTYASFRYGLVSPSLAVHFSSGEQAFRSEASPQDVLKLASPNAEVHKTGESPSLVQNLKRVVGGALVYRAYPERRDSLDALVNLENANPEAKSLVYPHHAKVKPREGEDSSYVEWWNAHWDEPRYPQFGNLKHRIVRPSPELNDRWGVTHSNHVANTQDFITKADEYGFEGFALNAEHLLRLPGQGFVTKFEDFDALVAQLLPYTEIIELHPVDLGEKDYSLARFIQEKELRLLQLAKDAGWKGLIVLHYPFGAMKQKSANPSPLLDQLREFYV